MARRLSMLLLALLLAHPAVALAWDEDPAVPPGPVVVDVGLDPGHSRADVGAAGGGLRECELTLAVANKLRDLLQERGFTVAMSRYDAEPLTDFSAPDPIDAVRLEQEARIAAVGSVGMYVSIHFNGHPDPEIRGLEVYFNGDNHGEKSLALATAIHDRLLARVWEAGFPLADRGVKDDLVAGKPYGHFFSLRGDLPSVLVEAMFLTNPDEAAAAADEAVLEAVAAGIAEGIREYLGARGQDVCGTRDQ